MHLVFLGTGGYHPSERRHTACLLLPESGVVFDAGTAAFRLPAYLEERRLNLFLSHAHLDHIAGLTFLLAPMLKGEIEHVRLHGTPKTLAAVREHLLAEPVFPVLPDFEYVELAERHALPGGGVLTHVSLEHPGGCRGYRIDWPDRSLAYITDTTAPGMYREFIEGVDLLIHECYFSDDLADWAVKTGHSHTTPVAQLARDAGVGRLVLVHIDPQRDDDDPIDLGKARSVFPPTEIAEDGMRLEF